MGSHACNEATRGDMGWDLFLHRQYCEVIRYWCRLKNCSDERLCKKVHIWSLGHNQRYSWERSVKTIISKVGMEEIIEPEIRLNSKLVIRQVHENLSVSGQVLWHSKLWDERNNENGNKLRLYRIHKSRLEPEPYVTQFIHRNQRKIVARLRSGSLPIAVETGRYSRPKIPLENRICTLCSQNFIEDEIHFLIDCEQYSDLRYDLFTSILEIHADFESLPSLVKYCLLMSEETIQCKLARTVLNMYNRRKLFI